MSMWQKIKNIYHLILSVFANLWFGFPSKKLIIIGVTGTDGKTTTVSLIYHILKQSGLNVSMISTVGAIINGRNYDIGFHVTTPSPWGLQKLINRVSQDSDSQKKYLILEVTSHAIDQYRIWGINFNAAVLTNVTNEHLDYHKNYMSYLKTKVKLLKMTKINAINKDDRSYKYILGLVSNISGHRLITYGMSKAADVSPDNFPVKTKIEGVFNQYNILAAVSIVRTLGLNNEDIKKALESYVLPAGREEIVYKNNFSVMIDFAHTPNGLTSILSTIRPKIKGRIIHVFGCAGERDKGKRPEMGKISSEYSDVIIFTAEDPRSESVERIINEIESGINISQKIEIHKLVNRQEAINTAVKMAKKGDFVLITGKGHEKSMNFGNGEESWSEYEAVKKALKIKNEK